MALQITQERNTLTPEELSAKRDAAIKELYLSVKEYDIDKEKWKTRKDNKSPIIYINNTQSELWGRIPLPQLMKLKRLIESSPISTTAVGNKASLTSLPFREFFKGSKSHTVYTTGASSTAKELETDTLVSLNDTTLHPMIVPINQHSLRDNMDLVKNTISTYFFRNNKLSDWLSTASAYQLQRKTCEAHAIHGDDVASSPAVAICVVDGEIPTNDEDAKASKDWDAKSMYYLAKYSGVVIFNLLDDNDMKVLETALNLTLDEKLVFKDIALSIENIEKGVKENTVDTVEIVEAKNEMPVDTDEIPF